MSGPRILVFAYSDVGHACLKLLLDRGENVVAVYTHQDMPGENAWFPSVAALAEGRNIPVRKDADLARPEEILKVRTLAPELIFSFYYRDVLPQPVIEFPKLGAYNIHGSLLPKYRGRAPVNWAVLHGETQTGATLHLMTIKPDAGDIVDQEPVPIGPDDTAAIVQRRVTAAAVLILERQLENLKTGQAPRRPQDSAQVTSFGRRRPEDGEIDWSRTAQAIHNLVRAVSHPYPGAFTDIFGKRTFIWQTRAPGLAAHDIFPGQIRVENGRLYVACGDDYYVEVLRAQTEGEPEIDGTELAARIMPGGRSRSGDL
jgi:methionyl-tRNA formyltransferase